MNNLKTNRNTYVVTGRPRSGTSMMMHALSVSGLEAVYDKKRIFGGEVWEVGFYNHPNPNGFFEEGKIDYINGEGENLVCKKFLRMLNKLPQVPNLTYNLVFMCRPDEEISASLKRSFPNANLSVELMWSIQEGFDYIESRDDMRVVALNFSDVINKPYDEFQKLVDAGWPIDPSKAASIVDPNLYRHRIVDGEVKFILDDMSSK